jgi:hypothetical protein
MMLLGSACILDPAWDSVAADGRSAKTVEDKSAVKPLPTFDVVTKQVQELLALEPEYQAGDLLTASKVERILAKLDQIHWKVADRREIIKLVLSDSDWLARRLAISDAKQFMRQVGAMPGGYDRVDRIRGMVGGEYQIADFIQSPEGFKMIEYMTTTQEGKNLGELVSEGVNGRDFNKPTGRIYTERDLLKRLQTSYDAEVARRHGLDPKQSTKPGTRKSPASKFPSKTNRMRRAPTKPVPDEATTPADSANGAAGP